MKIYTNELSHMTNMATTPIYGKNLKKIYFSRTNRLMTLILGMEHCLCKYYQDCSNYEPGLTFTHFMPRSDLGKSEKYYFLETIAALGLKFD